MPKMIAAALAIITTIHFSSISSAAEIVVVGDSMGVLIDNAITTVAGTEGFTVDNQARNGRRATQMVTASGLAELTIDLDANPDAKVAFLTIGGNDLLGSWNSGIIGTQAEQDLFDSIKLNVETIANHIATVRPDIQTYHLGYEYPRPLPLGTPAQVNQALLTFSAMNASIDVPNYNYIEFHGLTQKVFGAGVNDPSLPGAAAAFRDAIHLNEAGNMLFAEAAYNQFRVHLVPEPTSGTALLMTSLGMLGIRRRRHSAVPVL